MILVKGKLRREAISLLPDDASLLWHELDLRLICPVSVCPLTTAQPSASLPSNLLVYSKRMFFLKQGSRKSGEPGSGNLDSGPGVVSFTCLIILPLAYLWYSSESREIMDILIRLLSPVGKLPKLQF